jgi:hypothetical protein
MGTTLWVVSKSKIADGDDWDHSALFNAVDKLDRICEQLGLANFSSFLDWTDFEANMSEDEDEDDEFPSEELLIERASWFDPSDALPILLALRDRLTSNESERKSLFDEDRLYLSDELLEELGDCIAKVEKIEAERDLFHFSVVM